VSPQHNHSAELGIVCLHVLRGERQVNFISHHPDGTWSLVCGQSDHEERAEDFSVVCAECGLSKFGDLPNKSELAVGWAAERSDGSQQWIIRPMCDSELD
jgi:hypothetical protein